MPKRLRTSSGCADGIETVDAHGAARRLEQRRQHLDRRRLAGAVRAEEREDLAGLDLERHVVDGADGFVGLRVAEDLAQALHFDHGRSPLRAQLAHYAPDSGQPLAY